MKEYLLSGRCAKLEILMTGGLKQGRGVAYVANNLFPHEYLNYYWRMVLWFISTYLYFTYVTNNLFPC